MSLWRTRCRGGWALILGAILVALVAATVACGSGSRSSARRSEISPGGTGTGPALRAPTADRPLRVWLMGDSLADGLKYPLEPLCEGTGVIAFSVTTASGTGLGRPDVFDWPATVKRELATRRPEAVVVVLGTNDINHLYIDGSTYYLSSYTWRVAYRERVAEILRLMSDAGVQRVYWVGVPMMDVPELPKFNKYVPFVNACIRDEVRDNRPLARYIDAWALFSDAQGRFDPRWREPDGIHLNAAGSERLARAVMRVVDEDWGIEK